VGLGSGSLGCRTFFFLPLAEPPWGCFRRFDGFAGESLLQSPITRALPPDVTSVGACVLPHGHGHGLGALGVGWGFMLGCSLAPVAWVFFGEGLLGACASRLPLPSQTFVPTGQHGCHFLPHALFSVCCDAAGCPLLGWAGFVCRGGSSGGVRSVGASCPATACLALLCLVSPLFSPVRCVEAMSV
jgi:hypothetical protein